MPVMQLQKYLQRENLTASQVAARIDRSVSTVTRAMRGEVIPDPDTMKAITVETGGEVTPNDFYGFANGGPAPEPTPPDKQPKEAA